MIHGPGDGDDDDDDDYYYFFCFLLFIILIHIIMIRLIGDSQKLSEDPSLAGRDWKMDFIFPYIGNNHPN